MLKAYKVWCDDDDHGQIVRFAARGKDIDKRCNADQCDCHLLECHVTRAPEFDKYAPGPVTIHDYLAEGWQFECSGCHRFAWHDEDHAPVIVNEHVYHSGDCVQADLDSHHRWHKKGDRLHESLRKHLAAIKRWLSRQTTLSNLKKVPQ